MSEQILDCHHVDITEIVAMRPYHRWQRKEFNFQRYRRQYARRAR